MKETVCVLGEGAWGTAFATLLAYNGHQVNLWCHDRARGEQLKKDRYNETYLPRIKLSEAIRPMATFKEALCGVRWVFEAIPTQFMRQTLGDAYECYASDQIWVVLSKGIEEETLFFPTQIIADTFHADVKTAVVSGPNFALELAQKKITAATIGAAECPIGIELQKLLANEYFRPYICLDPIGVQVGGALKNVIALAVGMLDGAGYGDNAKAFVLTRGLQDMVTVAQAVGGKQDTLYGLCGVGDLVLTAMGKSSRNREVGYRLARGEGLAAITVTAEGIAAIQAMHQLSRRYALDAPICAGLYEVVFQNKPLSDWITELMRRPLEHEHECAV